MISLNDSSPVALSAAADENLATHAGWTAQRTPGMHVAAADDLVVVDSGQRCDTFNIVCRARLDSQHAPARIREVVAYFADAGRPFSWWLSPGYQPPKLDELLRAAGLQPADTEVAMAVDLAALQPDDPAPDGLEIRRVRSAAELRDFAQIIAAGWTPPDPEVLRFYERAAPALLTDDAPLWLYVGYLRQSPVATAELTVGGGVAGLYNIVTLADYRRRGIGTALMIQPLLDARALGYRTAILQAAAAGVGLYTRLGFTSFGQITEYKPA